MRATSKVLLDPSDTHVFHWTDGARRPWCEQATTGSLVPVEDARELGYAPCKHCQTALNAYKIKVAR